MPGQWSPSGGFGGLGGLVNFAGDVRNSPWRPGQPGAVMPGGLRLPGGGLSQAGTPQGPWDANDPLGGAFNLEDPIRSMIRYGGKQGVFGPDYFTNQLRGRAMRNADAGKQRTSLLAQLLGFDPMQYRGAMVDADIAANQNTVGALNDAELQGMSGYQDMLRNFLSQERYGVDVPRNAADVSYGRQRQQDRRNMWGNLAGSVVGAGVGALTGGIGGGGRAQQTRQEGGGSTMGSPGFQYPFFG